ncbi:hypothetical protein ABDD95_20310 [Mucilaginibacter sp. PAMB04274]|uniref:hypothetical protein n=1 Tax=Mucilaginibacter sp. PAMB04274 TaxID=3138568 RepID=UPI0031F6AA75
MLHQITWQQYLLLVTAALLIYYLIIWFRYYPKDPSRAAARSPALQPTPASEQELRHNDGLLGRPADDYGASTVDSEELIFGPVEEEFEEYPEDDDPDAGEDADRQAAEVMQPVSVNGRADNDELLQGDMADLLEDIKLVFYFIKKHKPADRAGLVSRMAKKVELYPRVLESELLELVLEDICDKALFEVGFEIGPSEIQEAIIYHRDSYQAGPFSKKGKW